MPDHSKVIVQLRAEVGEIIHNWVLLRHFLAMRSKEMTDDLPRDMSNQNLWFLNSVIERLETDAVARLAELADTATRGRINFAHANKALKALGLNTADDELRQFHRSVTASQLLDKRNKEISHKAFVEDWSDERAPIYVPYHLLVKTIALAVRVMKRIDRIRYGAIHAAFFWKELRGRRYTSALPPRIGYMIAQEIRIPEALRAKIILDEVRRGIFHQELMSAIVNGTKVEIYVSKKWGAINLGGQLLVLPQYPLQSIEHIECDQIKLDPAWNSGENVVADSVPPPT